MRYRELIDIIEGSNRPMKIKTSRLGLNAQKILDVFIDSGINDKELKRVRKRLMSSSPKVIDTLWKHLGYKAPRNTPIKEDRNRPVHIKTTRLGPNAQKIMDICLQVGMADGGVRYLYRSINQATPRDVNTAYNFLKHKVDRYDGITNDPIRSAVHSDDIGFVNNILRIKV